MFRYSSCRVWGVCYPRKFPKRPAVLQTPLVVAFSWSSRIRQRTYLHFAEVFRSLQAHPNSPLFFEPSFRLLVARTSACQQRSRSRQRKLKCPPGLLLALWSGLCRKWTALATRWSRLPGLQNPCPGILTAQSSLSSRGLKISWSRLTHALGSRCSCSTHPRWKWLMP